MGRRRRASRPPHRPAPLPRRLGRGHARPDTAIRLLTSGTTGPPKRVDLTFRTLERVLEGAKHYESQRAATYVVREVYQGGDVTRPTLVGNAVKS